MATAKKTPKITDYDTHSESPFTVDMVTKTFAPKADHKVMQGEDGTMYGMYEIPKNKQIVHDPALFTKLMRGNALKLTSLTEAAHKMFYYITEHLEPGSDEVCIIMADYLSFFGYKPDNRFAYYKSIEGLLRNGIIARKTGSTTCFYINPNIIFNGDRTKLKNARVISEDNSNYKISNGFKLGEQNK